MKDYETRNARRWEDDDTVVSVPTEDGTSPEEPVDESPLISMLTPSEATLELHTPQVQLPLRPATNEPLNTVHVARNPSLQVAGSLHATGSRRRASVTATYTNPGAASRVGRTQSSFRPAKDLWAEAEGLVTTKKANYIEYTNRATKERDQYLHPPPADESFPSTGTFLWPYRRQTPVEIFGSRLTPLNAVRIEHEAFIDCVTTGNGIQYLRISSRNPNADMAGVFDSIRRAIQDAKARSNIATAQYLFVPPTAKAMRKIVRALVLQTLEPMSATSFVLSGDPLSLEDRKQWYNARPGMVARTQQLFHTKLITGLTALEAVKGWMRMRVIFGHVVFKMFTTPFAEGKYSYEDFVAMVSHPRQNGYLNKKIGGSETAVKLCEKIVEWPGKFVPVNGRSASLSDVKFKNTAVIFLKTKTEDFRLETEIDRIFEREPSEFQAGSVRLFVNKKTKEGLNITLLDVERQLDWQLEVRTDTERFDVPKPLYDLIHEAISVKSKVRKDPHGLEYPNVTPSKYNKLDYHITSIVVRSDIQYKLFESGFVVELSIFREWFGSTTSGEPTMSTSVSMFHPTWETELESIENTLRVRNFGPGLVNLFNGQSPWLEPFLDEVNFTHGLLVDVTSEIKKEAAAKAKAADDLAIAAAERAAADVMAVAQWPTNAS
ncbi:hypothetical protein VTL71DRAFT_6071 [Oculimacula yallundae]|uniref:DUF7905 domain-containing protein n=1 Tax=Oculimacula yallundae TaxID=86028 RepID=A0ABR4BZB1_9HELO